MNKFLSYIVILMSTFLGGRILWTKELPIGIGNLRGGSEHIGSWAYLVGGIFIIYGFYVFYSLVYKQKK